MKCVSTAVFFGKEISRTHAYLAKICAQSATIGVGRII